MARANLTIAVGDWNALNVKLTYIAGRVQNLDETGAITVAALTIDPSVNVVVYDTAFFIADNLDVTKLVRFEVSGVTTGTTRVLTVPDADDTLVGKATTDTLTNKTWNGVKIGLAYGGTNADLSATGGTSQVLKQTSAGGAVTVAQLAASDLSNGTTGTNSVVLSTSPSVTSLTVSDGILILKSAQLQCFRVRIQNTAGTLQHLISTDFQNSGLPTFCNKVSAASSSLSNTPLVDATTAFVTGVGIEAATPSIFHLDTAAQTAADLLGVGFLENDTLAILTGAETRAQLGSKSINVNGTTRNRICVKMVDTNGAAWSIDTANIPAGQAIIVRIFAFIT